MLDGTTWRNELGSTMTFTADPTGGLTGTYVTGAGRYQGVEFPLVGRFDTQPDPTTRVFAIGWTVVWEQGDDNAHSVTTWSGQLHMDGGVIDTTWLLTSETSAQDAWGDTLVGKDTFTPEGSAATTTAQPLARAASHPV